MRCGRLFVWHWFAWLLWETFGFTGGAAASYNLTQGIKDCDAAWQELFGAFD